MPRKTAYSSADADTDSPRDVMHGRVRAVSAEELYAAKFVPTDVRAVLPRIMAWDDARRAPELTGNHFAQSCSSTSFGIILEHDSVLGSTKSWTKEKRG